jgi:hypothetical protein
VFIFVDFIHIYEYRIIKILLYYIMPSNKRISYKKKNGGGFKSFEEIMTPGGNYYATLGHVFQSDGFQRVVKNFRVMRPRSNASSKKSNRTYNILKLYNNYLKKGKSILEIGEEYIAYIKNKQQPENKLFNVFTKYLRRAIPRFKVQTLKKLSRRYSNTDTSLHDSNALQFRDQHIRDEERNKIMRMQSAQQPQFSRPQPQQFSRLQSQQFSTLQPQQFSRLQPQQFSTLQPQQFSRLQPQQFSRLQPQQFSTLQLQPQPQPQPQQPSIYNRSTFPTPQQNPFSNLYPSNTDMNPLKIYRK